MKGYVRQRGDRYYAVIDLPTPFARHSNRRRHRHRAARQARSPGRQRHGGTVGEPPEEERLNRGKPPATMKTQVADLGLHQSLGGGGRI